MKDSKNWIIGGLVVLCIGLYLHQSTQPKHPILRWLGSIAKTALWVAPFVLDEGPKEEPRYTIPQYAYGEMPVRATGPDGHVVLEHGDNW